MARSLEQYRDLFLLLLPRGDAWDKEPDGIWSKLGMAVAEECRRIELRQEGLVDESNPRTVFDLIDEWEKDWDLPTDCTGPLATLQERRNALEARMVGIANQSRQTYIDEASKVGYPITITEYAAGDAIPGHPEAPAADAAYWLQINAGATTVQDRTYSAPYGEPYASWGNELLECTIKQISQAHEILIFSYT